jgi:hypothetical protein
MRGLSYRGEAANIAWALLRGPRRCLGEGEKPDHQEKWEWLAEKVSQEGGSFQRC